MTFMVGVCVGVLVGAVVTAILVQRDEEQRDYGPWVEHENTGAFFARLEREWRS